MSETTPEPTVPDGWTVFHTQYGDSVGLGAKKWFVDHYKEVVADTDAGDLYAACAALDLEVQLRAEATANAAHTAADALEAKAAALRTTGPDTRTLPDPGTPAPLEEPAPDNAPVTVPTDAEVHTDSVANDAAEPEQDPVGETAQDAAPDATETPSSDEIVAETPADPAPTDPAPAA